MCNTWSYLVVSQKFRFLLASCMIECVYQSILQEFQRQAKMKSCFLYVAYLFLIFMVISGTMGCDPRTGPAGLSQCFLSTPYYSKHQCGTCLTDTYIAQKSKGKYGCRDTTATYCYYQCMVESYEITEGPVYYDCLCDQNVPLPQPSEILPPSCYSPDGTDCSWYSSCLARMFDCTGQAEYVIQYSEKACNVLRESRQNFTAKGLRWIDAARKCLQVELVPLLRLCRERPTCQTIRKTAFDSHVPCYLSPYRGSSVCDIPKTDWEKFFFTINQKMKKEYVSPRFVEALKTLLTVVGNCTTGNYRNEIVKNLYASDVRLSITIRKPSSNVIMPDDDLAYAIVLRISLSLHWDQRSTMDWFAFAVNTGTAERSLTSPTNQSTRGLTIQVIGLN